jgi:hypothetical protein
MPNDKNSDSADRASEACAAYGSTVIRATPLAPDGLPWPEGYFDRIPKVTLEEAIAEYGVRPSRYHFGLPSYSEDDCRKPNFKDKLPPEPDYVAELIAETDRRER